MFWGAFPVKIIAVFKGRLEGEEDINRQIKTKVFLRAFFKK